MIGKTHRFHGHGSLRRVYQHGKTVRTQNIALKYLINDRRSSWRGTVVVARKVHKSAVVRNRIRRRIYGVLRAHLSSNTPACDMIFSVFHDSIEKLDAKELDSQITHLLKSAGILPSKLGQTLPRQRDIIEDKE